MLTVKKVAHLANVTSDTIRHYVKMGLLTPTRGSNNYRVFTQKDVERVKFIRLAQRLGFTLQEIEKIFAAAANNESACPLVRDIIKSHLTKNQQVIDELLTLQNRMKKAVELWETLPDKHSDSSVVCHLIEAGAS